MHGTPSAPVLFKLSLWQRGTWAELLPQRLRSLAEHEALTEGGSQGSGFFLFSEVPFRHSIKAPGSCSLILFQILVPREPKSLSYCKPAGAILLTECLIVLLSYVVEETERVTRKKLV